MPIDVADIFPAAEESNSSVRLVNQFISALYSPLTPVADINTDKLLKNNPSVIPGSGRANFCTAVTICKWARANRIIWQAPAREDLNSAYAEWTKTTMADLADPPVTTGFIWFNFPNPDDLDGVLFDFTKDSIHLSSIVRLPASDARRFEVNHLGLNRASYASSLLELVEEERKKDDRQILHTAIFYLWVCLDSFRRSAVREKPVQLPKIKAKGKTASLLISREARLFTPDLNAVPPTTEQVEALKDELYQLLPHDLDACVEFLERCSAWQLEVAAGILARFCIDERVLVKHVLPLLRHSNESLVGAVLTNLAPNLKLTSVRKAVQGVVAGKGKYATYAQGLLTDAEKL